MKSVLDKNLFFSMTYDFLTVYIPQDSASCKTVKSYRDGLTVFRRYVADVKKIAIRTFTFEQCTFDFVLEYRNWLLDDQKKAKSTVNNRIAAIKSYMYYAAAKDISLQQIQINYILLYAWQCLFSTKSAHTSYSGCLIQTIYSRIAVSVSVSVSTSATVSPSEIVHSPSLFFISIFIRISINNRPNYILR